MSKTSLDLALAYVNELVYDGQIPPSGAIYDDIRLCAALAFNGLSDSELRAFPAHMQVFMATALRWEKQRAFEAEYKKQRAAPVLSWREERMEHEERIRAELHEDAERHERLKGPWPTLVPPLPEPTFDHIPNPMDKMRRLGALVDAYHDAAARNALPDPAELERIRDAHIQDKKDKQAEKDDTH